MMKMDLNEEEKRKAIVENVKENVFVEAGAGAGKTTLIVQRILNQMKKGLVTADQIVVITFTNKAAEELYSRIEGELRKQVKDEGISTEEREKLKAALNDIANMNISTIHSFCHRILTEHSFEAKLPVDVQLLEEQEALQWKIEWFDKWFAKLSKDTVNQLKQFVGGEYKGYLLDAFLKICDMAHEVKIPYDKSALVKTYEDYEKIFAETKENMEHIVVEKVKETLGDGYENFETVLNHDKIKKAVTKLYSSKFDVNWIVKFKGCIQDDLFQRNGTKENKLTMESLNEQCKAAVGGIDVDAIKTEYDLTCYSLLMHYAMEAREFYLKNKESRYITNDQLLQKARDLVCGNQQVHEDIINHYKCLYVDEFQDVDPVQAELVMCIAKRDKADSELREGSLFLVGDPKQSIYRFRGAEPAIYFDIKEIILNSSNGQVYELDNNYRSDEKVIEWVNQHFQSEIDGYHSMVYPRPKNTLTDAKVLSGIYRYDQNQLTGGENNKKNALIKVIQEDANQLSEMIRFLVDQHYKITYADEKGSFQQREITYGDFLVLCRNTTNMSVYTKSMSDKGIPFQLSGNMKLNENMVLKHFQLLYQYLVCPQNKMYREGALQVVLREKIAENNEEIGKCCLKQLRNAVKGMSGCGIAGYLLSHMELLLPRDTILQTEQVRSAQTKLEQMVESVLAATDGNPLEMANAFKTYREGKVDREMFLEESPNAVRFMNVHKSKGLEGNIVVLADRSENVKAFKGDSVRYRKKNGNNIEYSYYGCIGNYNGFGNKYCGYLKDTNVQEYTEEEGKKEQTRLEYVTATRAKNALIFMNPIQETCAFSGMDLSAQPSITMMMEAATTEEEILQQSEQPKEIPEYEPVCVEPDSCMSEKQYISLSPSDLERSVKVGNNQSSAKQVDRPTGNVFGTVMHRCFELLLQRWQQEENTKTVREGFNAIKGNLDEIIILAIMEKQQDMKKQYGNDFQNQVNQYQNYLKNVLSDFMDDADIQELLAGAETIYTEYPFSFYTSKEKDPALVAAIAQWIPESYQEQEIWVNGTADLVLRMKGDSIFVLDYKSDVKKPDWTEKDFEKHLSKYDGQLTLYRYAMAKIFDVPVEQVETGLYTIEKGE